MSKRHKGKSGSTRKQTEQIVSRKPLIWLSAAALLVAIAVYGVLLTPVNNVYAGTVTVYKSPTCGCCKKWVTHLESEGFKVDAHNRNDMDSIKDKYGVASSYQSCHTALINGYVVEGHVPADDIKRLLKERPEIKGLSVPGMVMGSPGMGGRRVGHYEVLAIDNQNQSIVFSNY